MKKLLLTTSMLIFAYSAFSVPFTLRNNGLKSIYLEIPGVMNPNLSPLSNSGVDLAPGQKIYFLHKGQRYLLLEVTEQYEGKKIKVNRLIKDLKMAGQH